MKSEESIRRKEAVIRAAHCGDEALAMESIQDTDAIVRASAFGTLAKLNLLDSHLLDVALRDDDPIVRRRACELATHFETSVDSVSSLLHDKDDSVVEQAAWAIGECSGRSQINNETVLELCKIATEHSQPLCRESAVAALGSIGESYDCALQAILKACTDKPAIRRRAVVALSAFEGDDVQEALQRALIDRDWQVRQIAEDLLGET